MPLSVRDAIPADLQTLVAFNARLAHESEGKNLEKGTLERGVAALLAAPARGRYFVATDNDEVVGQLMITTEWSDWRNGWFWWIQSVYVHEDARRRGVYRALHEHVTQAASTAGDVVGIRLYVERDNAAALATYARVGMSDAGYLVLEQMLSRRE